MIHDKSLVVLSFRLCGFCIVCWAFVSFVWILYRLLGFLIVCWTFVSFVGLPYRLDASYGLLLLLSATVTYDYEK